MRPDAVAKLLLRLPRIEQEDVEYLIRLATDFPAAFRGLLSLLTEAELKHRNAEERKEAVASHAGIVAGVKGLRAGLASALHEWKDSIDLEALIAALDAIISGASGGLPPSGTLLN